jgi:hypothetical protein
VKQLNVVDFLRQLDDIKRSNLTDDAKHAKILLIVAETDLANLIKQLKE